MSLAEGNVTGVVAALRSEARCLPPRRVGSSTLLVAAGGMGCESAARTAHRLVLEGAGALLCWGVAGALDPALRCGDIVLATEVICDGPLKLRLDWMQPAALPARARLRTSAAWRAQLDAALAGQGSVTQAPVLTSSALICAAPQKARLFHDTGAVAVDMESVAVGIVAKLYNLPFMVLRVIADPASDALPDILGRVVARDAGGGPAWMAWLSLLAAPGAWPGLIRLGQRYRTARRELRHCARHVEPASAQVRTLP